MDVEGMGERLADRLVDLGLVKDLADLYSLDAGALSKVERMGARSSEKLIGALREGMGAGLERVLTGLGIPGVGRVVASALSARFRTMEAVASADASSLQEVEGVGPVIAESLEAFFASEITSGVVKRLARAGVLMESRATGGSGPLDGLTIVFTGALSMSRDAARRLAEEAGARVSESVSPKTGLVVAGPGAGAKLDRARELGIRTTDEQGFLGLIGAR